MHPTGSCAVWRSLSIREKKEKVKEPKKPKVESVKVELSTEGSRNDVNALDGEMFAASQGKLEALAKADADRAAIELALNELQGYSVDLVDKLEDEEFQAASTDEEREKLRFVVISYYILSFISIEINV